MIGFNDKTEFEKAEKKAGGLTGFKLVGSGTRERNQDRYIVHFDEIQPDEDEVLKDMDEAAFDDAITDLLDDAPVTYIEPSIVMHAD